MKEQKVDAWIPSVFALTLSMIVMATMFVTGSFEPGMPAFFCFIPFVSFFTSSVLASNQRRLAELQARIDQLEKEPLRRTHG